MSDLYAVLGVSRKASPSTVRKAYRKRAQQTHPDRNSGESDEFKSVNLAYRILSNPEKRKKYDATGEAEDKADTSMSPIVQFLSQSLVTVMNEVLASGASPEKRDMVSLMRKSLKEQAAKMSETKQSLGTAMAAFKAMSGRFAVKTGENLFQSMIDWHLSQVELQLQKADKAIEVLSQAEEALKDVTFRFEQEIMMRGWSATATCCSPSATGGGFLFRMGI